MNCPLISLQIGTKQGLYKYHGCYRSIIKVNYCCANEGDSRNRCGSNALETYFSTPWITNGNRVRPRYSICEHVVDRSVLISEDYTEIVNGFSS